MGICLGNFYSQGNFQLHWFTTSENIAKSFLGATFFDSHCTLAIEMRLVQHFSKALIPLQISHKVTAS